MTLETASLSLEGLGDGNFGRGLGIARGYIGDEETISPMINRDLSLVEFFWRVLEEAIDSEQPLLERIKFMGILSTLFDEFFMIRVSGLKVKAERLMEVTPDGLTAAEQVTRIRERLLEMIDLQYKCYHSELLPALKTEEIRIASYSSLSSAERASLDDFFKQNIFPVLTPQAVDLSHPFPYISGLCLNIALTATPTLHKRSTRAMSPDRHEFFIRMKIPQFLPRLVPLKGEDSKFVWVEDLIASNIREIIPEADSAACHFFRITRDADIEVHESEAHDLLEAMEENLKLRRFGEVVRLDGHVDLALETTAQANQTGRVFRQQFLVDPRLVMEPVEVRDRDHLHQVAITGFILRQESEMVGGIALVRRPVFDRARRHVSLATDDRLYPRVGRRLVKLNRAMQIPVIGDRDRGHLEVLRLFHQLLHSHRAVEEGVFGVEMQVNEGIGRHPLAV